MIEDQNEPEDYGDEGNDEFPEDFISPEQQLIDAVLDDGYTLPILDSSNFAIETSLSKMAAAFADACADGGHQSALEEALKKHGGLDAGTARDQAKHAFDVMKQASQEMDFRH